MASKAHDVARPETAPNRHRVLAAIPEHAVGTLPRSSADAVQWENRIHQPEGFLRIAPIRTGQTHRQRHVTPVADQMALTPALGRSVGFGPYGVVVSFASIAYAQ